MTFSLLGPVEAAPSLLWQDLGIENKEVAQSGFPSWLGGETRQKSRKADKHYYHGSFCSY